GERADVPRLLKASDVFLFPSLREGLPGAVLEACAAGLAVVGSDIAPLREIAGHFPDVHCLPTAGPVSAWADIAQQALRSRRSTDRSQWAMHAFTRSPFDIGTAARAYLDVLRQSPRSALLNS